MVAEFIAITALLCLAAMVSPSFAANKEGATTPQPIKTTTLDSEIISERIHATDSQALLVNYW